MDDLKRKKKTIECDLGELVKDPLRPLSQISLLELKYSEWMNSRTNLKLVRLGPFYIEFGVSLLVRYH